MVAPVKGPIERWAPVVGYESYYEVSDQGRVRSLDRLIVDAIGRKRMKPGRVLSHGYTAGYPMVSLHVDGKGISSLVHRLVLEAFVGPCPDDMECCHADGSRTNAALSNLRWDTRSENTLDRVRHGTHHNVLKTHCPNGHPYFGDNLVVWGNGGRRCRVCDNESHKLSKRRRRAGTA